MRRTLLLCGFLALAGCGGGMAPLGATRGPESAGPVRTPAGDIKPIPAPDLGPPCADGTPPPCAQKGQ